ncbi:unnamed protein product [Cladocopium goreaui]|uniref:Uncharacterized protein n=1 Tax=Cladocopium goreaui TaxID=2562237 RepID=A0A9P1GRC0_9DINO|nr:unnamed protein product [Cladocopium goreaui]
MNMLTFLDLQIGFPYFSLGAFCMDLSQLEKETLSDLGFQCCTHGRMQCLHPDCNRNMCRSFFRIALRVLLIKRPGETWNQEFWYGFLMQLQMRHDLSCCS